MIKIFDIIYVQVFRYNEQIFAFSIDNVVKVSYYINNEQMFIIKEIELCLKKKR